MTDLSNTNQVSTDGESRDWCFRSQTANLLALSIAQIHMSLTEGDNSIDTLTQSFQDLAHFCMKVENLAKTEVKEGSSQEIVNVASDMSTQINGAIMAFQFYDRLCQRMSHVATSLDKLSELLKEEAHLEQQEGWQDLREQIKQQYTMKAEHQMYELIMQGCSPEEALAKHKDAMNSQDDENDIELF